MSSFFDRKRDYMETKKYYWIKLRKDFFERDDIDFILSQEKGCEYIVLYQMLCMKASNNDGFLGTKINEMIVPYDVKKITRDCKYFDYDTIIVALELYKKLGLVYEEENKVLKITDYDNLVGSETAWAEKKRLYREKQKMLGQKKDNVLEEIEIEKDIEKEIDIDNNIEEDINKINDAKQMLSNNIFDYYSNNIHCIVQREYEEIIKWEETFTDDIIKEAIDEAVLHNARNMKYISSILRNWKEQGYKTINDIRNNKQVKTEDDEEPVELFNYDWVNDEN